MQPVTGFQELKLLLHHYPWALTELVVDEKLKVVNAKMNATSIASPNKWALHQEHLYQVKVLEAFKISKSFQTAWAYMVGRYGSGHKVLSTLQWLVRVQAGPRKALIFQHYGRT